jgi:pimeloyl-ACP methyl ester carboxylesterase
MMKPHRALHTESIEIPRGSDTIYGDLRYPEGENRLPLIIICHSFMAFKDWGFFPPLAAGLADKGFATLAFNFSYNGVRGKAGRRIVDFEKFQHNTFSCEIEDCRFVLDAVSERKLGKQVVDPGKIIMLGHSRGGGIAIVSTANDPRVKVLVTLASISTFGRWREHQIEQWRAQGFMALSKHTKASPLKIGIELLEDYEGNFQALNIESAASRITVPWLIVHAKEDLTVKVAEAEKLYQWANKSTAELLLLDKAGHLFNAITEKEDHYQTLNGVIDLIAAWLHKLPLLF